LKIPDLLHRFLAFGLLFHRRARHLTKTERSTAGLRAARHSIIFPIGAKPIGTIKSREIGYMAREKRKSGKATKSTVKDLKAKKDPRGGATSITEIKITKQTDSSSGPLMK
jgi:hypothetical protein